MTSPDQNTETVARRAWRLAFLQGAFFVVSGIWPVVHMPSFVWVTGPKTDYWLVRTVGALLAVNGAALIAAARNRRVTAETKIVAAFVPLVLAVIDVVYVSAGVIRPIYFADAAVESLLMLAWLLTPVTPAHAAV